MASGFEKFVDGNVRRLAKEALRFGNVCNHCLGRQFAKIGHGFTNEERGKAIRKVLGLREPQSECDVCDGIFATLGKKAREIAKSMKEWEFDTFMVGTIMSEELKEREETFWFQCGSEDAEPLKTEINRELGKILEKLTGKRADRERPDIVVYLDLENETFYIEPSPAYFYGRYRKLVRGIPQTKWDKYEESVEDVIAKPFMRETGGGEHSLHGMGREDIDARCLGWRPFILEITKPRKRNLNLREIEKEINASGKVEVSSLRKSDRKEVARLKAARPDKSYRVLVEFERPVEGIEKLKELEGEIEQKTPSRVVHRRADIERRRKVKRISWKIIDDRKAELTIRAEAGLYIKELVTGDGGRTRPSVSEILGNSARVIELDVIGIHTGKEWD